MVIVLNGYRFNISRLIVLMLCLVIMVLFSLVWLSRLLWICGCRVLIWLFIIFGKLVILVMFLMVRLVLWIVLVVLLVDSSLMLWVVRVWVRLIRLVLLEMDSRVWCMGSRLEFMGVGD